MRVREKKANASASAQHTLIDKCKRTNTKFFPRIVHARCLTNYHNDDNEDDDDNNNDDDNVNTYNTLSQTALLINKQVQSIHTQARQDYNDANTQSIIIIALLIHSLSN